MSQTDERGSRSSSNPSEHEPLKDIGQDKAPKFYPTIKKLCRTDSRKLHRVWHSMLSREVLAGLVQAGEDERISAACAPEAGAHSWEAFHEK